jgi:mannose-1-phosphate guanylyltransferase/mannose-6-phosphate isomerase
VIICGGSGSRLWPASRSTFPKQFISLLGERSLLQATLARLRNLTQGKPLLVANTQHRFLVRHQLEEIGLRDYDLVLEPEGRNTAPAIALAAFTMRGDQGDPVLLVLPADHFVGDPEALSAAIASALPLAEAGHLVTFGIQPERAESGYGYIKCGAPLGEGSCACHIERFIEKPDLDTAKTFVQSPGYLWNSGMFMFRARAYLGELKRHAPDILAACGRAVAQAGRDLDFTRLPADAFGACPSDSIDYAVMERTAEAVVVPLDAGWSDVGSWSALQDALPRDADGNVIAGDVVTEGTHGCYLHATSRMIGAVGLTDHVVVETKDAVLVAPRDKVQDVKALVAQLKARGRYETSLHREVFRPWGSYDSIDQGERFQVKRLVVKPGASMSLQLHHHRAEHWIVVSGTARITRGEETFLLGENESTFIPIGTKHRIENPGKVTLHIIEVQSGSYLGEDDIVRFEDVYGREGTDK